MYLNVNKNRNIIQEKCSQKLNVGTVKSNLTLKGKYKLDGDLVDPSKLWKMSCFRCNLKLANFFHVRMPKICIKTCSSSCHHTLGHKYRISKLYKEKVQC